MINYHRASRFALAGLSPYERNPRIRSFQRRFIMALLANERYQNVKDNEAVSEEQWRYLEMRYKS